MALWGGRFTQAAADQRFKQLNDSLRFDYRLAEQDIMSSVAWSKVLVTVKVVDRGGATAARAGARRANGRGAGLISVGDHQQRCGRHSQLVGAKADRQSRRFG